MDAVIQEIMEAMKDGDSELVRSILVMNLKRKKEKEFVESLHKLKMKKRIIIQNLDILDIFKLIEYQGIERFNLAFWRKFYSYQLAVGDVQTLYKITKMIMPVYKDKLVIEISDAGFYTPAGCHDIKLNSVGGHVDILSYVLKAFNETAEHVTNGTILEYIGTVYTPKTALARGLKENEIYIALDNKRNEVFQSFIEDRIKLIEQV